MSSSLFGDPCPGTSKYVEVHYTCSLPPPVRSPSPDLSQCRSDWARDLQVRLEEEGGSSRLAEELASLASSRPLYGGDLAIIASIMEGEGVVSSSQAVQTTASAVLAARQEAAWRDLTPGARLEVASRLMLVLQHSVLLLAESLSQAEERREVSQNVLSSVRVMEAGSLASQTFPSPQLEQDRREAEVRLEVSSLNQLRVDGAVRIVFLLYSGLERWLVPVSQTRDRLNFLNSRVLSVLVPAGRSVPLSEPIELTLQHLERGERGSEGLCVRWDLDSRTWSEDSCVVTNTNSTHTQCLCYNFGDFALMMNRPSTSEEAGTELWSIVGGIVSVLVGVLVTVLVSCIIRRVHLKTGRLGCLHCRRGSKTEGLYPTISCSPTSTTLSGTPTTITTMESNYFLHSECPPPPPPVLSPAQVQQVKSVYQLEACSLHPVSELEVRDLRPGYLRPVSPLGHIYMEIDPVYSRHHHLLTEEELRRPLIRNTLRRTVATPGLRSIRSQHYQHHHHPPISLALSQAGEHYVSLNLQQRSEAGGFRTVSRPGPE